MPVTMPFAPGGFRDPDSVRWLLTFDDDTREYSPYFASRFFAERLTLEFARGDPWINGKRVARAILVPSPFVKQRVQ